MVGLQKGKYLQVSGSIFFALLMILSLPAHASIKGDGSTNTDVNKNKKDHIYHINGGKKIGKNLLHSFLEFSFGKNWKAQFEVPDGLNIFNIIARVTGNNASKINGELKIDGGSHPINLFLINPNGILFGPNAKLNLSGSFLATTAESITFSSGYKFSATHPSPLPLLLKLGVPVGLQFGKNPAPIIGNFSRPSTGLNVKDGQTLALIGGDVILHGSGFSSQVLPSNLYALFGIVSIGSVGSDQTVGLQSLGSAAGWKLDFSKVKKFKDILIDNGFIVGGGVSDIYLYGSQIELLDRTQIGGPILTAGKGGNIFIYADKLLRLEESAITTGTLREAKKITHIDIKAKSLELLDGSMISSVAFGAGSGRAGKIVIDANKINLESESRISAFSIANNESGVIIINTKTLQLNSGSEIKAGSDQLRKGGRIDISANLIELTNGSRIFTTSGQPKGNNQSGDININTDLLKLDHKSTISTSSIPLKNGPGGTINIFARSVELNRRSSIESNASLGDGGDINLKVKDVLSLRHKSNISTSSTETGDGGNIKINAGVIAAVPSEDSNIKATAETGNGGDIKITTKGLFGIYPAKVDAPSRSDITTSSQFGLDGTIDINILASRSVINFSTTPRLLKTKSLETVCFDNRRGDVDGFVNSGRGGLPVGPSDPAESGAVWQDLRPASSDFDVPPAPAAKSISETLQASSPASVVEAQGWVFGPDGSVHLVTANQPHLSPAPCLENGVSVEPSISSQSTAGS